MLMSPFVATILVAAFLFASGLFQLLKPEQAKSAYLALPRSKGVALVFLTLATLWFLWEIWHLGEPDFGNHKNKLLIGFAAVSVLSYFYIPDFLAVRAVCAFVLLSCDAVLDAVYMEPPISRLFLVGFVYLVIGISMYLASLPYRLRDFNQWLYSSKTGPKILATFLVGYGLFLGGIAFTY
jgi:magnesium-transporting ATPase (P-type)